MTNHPRRQRDNDDTAGETVEVPGDGAVPPQGSADVPAHTPNGLRPNAAKMIGQAVAESISQALPPAVFQAVAAALSQVPVQVAQQHLCATCLAGRIGWEHAHRAQMEAAMTAAAHAAGVPPASPESTRIDFGPFLPEGLRAGQPNGIPEIGIAVTTCQGTEVCPLHIPGVQTGGAPLLVATATMNPAMLGQLAG